MDRQVGRGLLTLTARIVAAHVSHHSVTLPEVSALIEQVHRTLADLGTPTPAPAPDPMVTRPRPEPAVPVNRSITNGYLICLEDGRKLKMLKRYLKVTYDMTPAQYRSRWGLPGNYPMVAPNVAQHRSSVAKKAGLGTQARGRRASRAS